MRETPAERRQTSKKGKRAAKRKAPDNESDEEYKMALKEARQQGGKVAAFMDSLQQTQLQQLAMINQFMGSIVKTLDSQQKEKEKLTLIQDYFRLFRDSHCECSRSKDKIIKVSLKICGNP